MGSASSTTRRDAGKRRTRAPEEPALLEPGRTCWRIGLARSGVIVDAADYYRALADAIEAARSHVLLSGWQIESSTWLRRRVEDQGRPRSLAEVVRAAVERNPDLRFYVLGWDWSSIYALDREWGTREKLIEAAHGRLEMIHDRAHAPGASHHEKLVIVDGHTAWVGGIDVCEHRWDERSHLPRHPMRVALDRSLHGPYHDVCAVVRGPVVRDLVEHFRARWQVAGGDPLRLRPEPEPREEPECHVSLGRARVAISRTRPATVLPLQPPLREIEALHVEAIRSARRLVLIETQYLTARAIVQALVARMRQGPPVLEIVIVVPLRLEGRMEKIAIEGPQRVAIAALRDVARERGHHLGVFSPCVPAEAGEPCPTYVHTKMMLIDDRFLTIGSANATNRSMGLDTELHLSWQAARPRDAVERGIRALRVSLLAEHTGLDPDASMRELVRARGLVARLTRIARGPRPRIVEHPLPEEPLEQGPIDELLASLGDPEHAPITEELFETIAEQVVERPRGLVARAVEALHELRGAR